MRERRRSLTRLSTDWCELLSKSRAQFLNYKYLKKVLKEVPVSKDGRPSRELTPEERKFAQAVSDELKKFNKFFMDREEEIVMKEAQLQQIFDQNEERIASAFAAGAYNNECLTADTQLCQRFANFHGELVLLEHWTNLNYAALVKILKKHDKRSNVALRSPFLVNALQQPFYSTEVLTAMIGRAEERFRAIEQRIRASIGEHVPQAHLDAAPHIPLRVSSDGSEISDDEDGYSIEHTKAALHCWSDLDKSEAIQNPLGFTPTGGF